MEKTASLPTNVQNADGRTTEGGPVHFQTQERGGAACCNPVYSDLESS